MNASFLALWLAALAACTAAPPPQNAGMQSIEGTAAYRERIALPPNAEFEAVLQDVSRAIDPARTYAVRATIRVDGKPWFTTDTAYPVLTRGGGRTVDIVLKRVAEPPVADAELLNTYWKILALAGEPVTVEPGKREPHVILRSADGRDGWSATVGCNSMSGALEVTGDRISFESGISTLMACPSPLDELERSLSRSLTASTQWRIEGDRLWLRDDAGAQTLLGTAVYLE